MSLQLRGTHDSGERSRYTGGVCVSTDKPEVDLVALPSGSLIRDVKPQILPHAEQHPPGRTEIDVGRIRRAATGHVRCD